MPHWKRIAKFMHKEYGSKWHLWLFDHAEQEAVWKTFLDATALPMTFSLMAMSRDSRRIVRFYDLYA